MPLLAPRRRTAFTLVELLVVVTIIVILVSLLLAGVYYAIARATWVRATADITMLGGSLQAFKAKYGVFPPSRIRLCSDLDAYTKSPTPNAQGGVLLDNDSKAFISRMWPNIGNTVWSVSAGGSGINWAGTGKAVDEILEGDQCLVFFLGGIPRDPSSGTLTAANGFSVNPKDPSAVTSTASIVPPFFAFDANRLKILNGANFPSYIDAYLQPTAANPNGAPYVFFSAFNRPNGYGKPYAIPIYGVQPYYTSAGKYYNPDTFQIICAGADGTFGAGGQWTPATADTVYPGNVPGGRDDMSNFSSELLGVAR